MKKTILILSITSTLASAMLADHSAGHTKTLVLKNKEGAAILGYDPVAYFTDSKAVKGNSKFKSNYDGANYYFATPSTKRSSTATPSSMRPLMAAIAVTLRALTGFPRLALNGFR